MNEQCAAVRSPSITPLNKLFDGNVKSRAIRRAQGGGVRDALFVLGRVRVGRVVLYHGSGTLDHVTERQVGKAYPTTDALSEQASHKVVSGCHYTNRLLDTFATEPALLGSGEVSRDTAGGQGNTLAPTLSSRITRYFADSLLKPPPIHPIIPLLR